MSRAGDAVDSRTSRALRGWALTYRGELVVLVALLLVALFAGKSMPIGVASLGVVGGFGLLLHAIGVILVYRTGRFVNFAQVQVGLVGAALFTSLVQGQFFPRVIDSVCGDCIGPNPSRTVLAVNFIVAAVLGLLVSAFVAFVCYFLIVQRFADQPRLVITIAMIFVAQALFVVQRQVGTLLTTEDQREVERVNPFAPSPPPWKVTLALDPVEIRLDSLLTVAVAIVATLAVAGYLRFSAAGVAVRAVAENPARARTLGISTSGVTARVWVLVGLLSGAGGVLAAFGSGSTGGAGSGGSVAVLPIRTLVLVLAIAVVARFASLAMATLAAVVFGLLQQWALWSFSSSAPLEVGIVVVIGGVLLLQRYRAGRSDTEDFTGWQAVKQPRPIPQELRRIPVVQGWTRAGAVVAAVVVVGLPWVLSPSQTNVASIHVAYVIVGMSLLLLTGWAGQVSLGQVGFAAVGAWITATTGLPLPLALLVGGLAGALVALLVGIPALKLRGLNLAIMTLAFAVSATTLLITSDYLGQLLPKTMPRPSLFGLDLGDQRVFYYATLVLAGLSIGAVVGIRRSRTGRVLIAARDNEAAVQSYGVNLLRVRLTAFAFSGFLAALAGCLLAYAYGAVTPAVFPPEAGLTLFAFTVIGGLGGVAGPIVGMVYLAVLTLLGANELVQAIGSGVVGLLVLATLPGGLAQGLYDVRDAMLRRVAVRHRVVVPSLFADRDPTLTPDRVVLDERKGRRAEHVPRRFEPERQWALARYGRDGQNGREATAEKERADG